MKPRALLRALTLALACSGGTARAQPVGAAAPHQHEPPTRILLLAGAGEEPLRARVAAELRSLGFEVATAAAEAATPPAPQLEARARALRASVAVQVSTSGSWLELWLVHPATHELVYRRIAADPDPAVAAFRLLEILRGSLIDLQALAPPVVPTVRGEPPREREAPSPELAAGRRQPISLLLGSAVARPGGDATASWYALASLRLGLNSRLSLNAFALAPVSRSTMAGPEGHALVTTGLLGAGLGFQPFRERRITPSVGAGVAAVVLHTRGVPNPGFSGTTQLDFAAYPHLRLDVSAAISPLVRFRAELLGGTLAPRPVLLFVDRRAGAWGNALLLAGLGFELVFR